MLSSQFDFEYFLYDLIEIHNKFILQATLLIPAMEWILQCVTYKAVSYDDLRRIWEYCKMSEKRQIIVRSFLNAVSPIYLNEHCLEACKIVSH